MSESKSRRRHMSVSSRRSQRSDGSADSHAANKRSLFRNRRPSQSSTRSQALIDDSDAESVVTNTLSRKTSHADDSDASGTDESLGETEEDVWFRDDLHDGDINVEELDQLLNLSDEEISTPRILVTEQRNEKVLTDPTADEVGREQVQTRTRLDVVTETKPNISPAISPQRVVEPQPGPRAEYQGSLVLSRTPQFVKYTPAVVDEKQGFSELGLNEEFDSSGSGSSGAKEQYVDPNEKPVYVKGGDPAFLDTRSSSLFKKNQNSDNGLQGTNHAANSGNLNPTTNKSANVGPDARDGSTAIASGSGETNNNTSANATDDEQSQRFSFYAANMESTIHAPDLASLVRENDSFSSLFNPNNGTWFLDCFRPTPTEMRALSRAFGIHPLTTEDIQTEEAREKFEKFTNYYLVVYHTFESDESNEHFIDPINFYILVFNEGVISFHFEPVSHCRSVRRRMRQLRDHLAFTSDWVAYALIDDITDGFAPQITAVEKEADFVENAVYLDRNSADNMHTLLQRLGEGRRMTMHLLRMLAGKADVVRGFAKRCNEVHNAAGSEMALYLGDIQDHVVTMYQNLSAYEKIFSRTHFNYMGLLQMEFVDSSNQMTSVLGKVTVLGTVLVPMNLVTGLFGMNVKIPGQDGPNLHWFFGILGVMLGVVVILLLSGAYYVKWSTRR